MFKIEIKTEGTVTNHAEFATEALCFKWMQEQKFELTERKILRADALKRGLNLTGKTPLFEEYLGVEHVFYMFPAPQTYTIANIDGEIQAQNEEKESAESLALVANLKTKIRALNKRKIKTGVWTAETFNAFIASPLIAQAERALNQASLGGYLSLIPQATAFYTAEEIAEIAALVNQHVQKWTAKGVV